jgi:hypothetical protein
MLPERPGNRMVAEVIVDKTRALGWKATISVADHIRDFCFANSKPSKQP